MPPPRRGYVPPEPRDPALRDLLNGIDELRDAQGSVSVDQVRELMESVGIEPPKRRPQRSPKVPHVPQDHA